LEHQVSLFDRAGGYLRRSRKKTLLLIFVIALAIRVTATLVMVGNAPLPVVTDGHSYVAYAKEITAGSWLTRPVSFREVGYPFFLSLVYRTLGESPLATRLCNAVLGALTCLLIFLLAEKILGFNAAVLAALLAAVNSHFVFFNTMILRETLLTFLFAAFLLFLYQSSRSRSWGYTVLAALALVVLLHTDARYLFHVPFAVLFYFAAGGGFKRAMGRAVIFSLVFVLLMIPWQYRNYKAYNRFVLVNTWTLEMPFPWQENATPVPEHLLHPSKRMTWPPEGARQLKGARRLIYNLNELYRAFRFRGEIKNNTTFYDKPWSAEHNAASILTYGLILPFFIYGFWIVLRRRWKEAYVLVIPVFAHTLLHVIKFALPRYRVPVEPAIIILGVLGAVTAWQAIKDRRRGVARAEPAQ